MISHIISASFSLHSVDVLVLICACKMNDLYSISKEMALLGFDWFSVRLDSFKAHSLLHVYTTRYLVVSSKSKASLTAWYLSTSIRPHLYRFVSWASTCLLRVWEKLCVDRVSSLVHEPVAVCPLLCVSTWSQFNPQAPRLCSHWLLSFTQLPIGPLGARIGTRYPISDLDYPIRRVMYVQRCLKVVHPRIIRR